MRKRNIVILVILLVLAVLLAFLLAGPARDLLIIPLAKLWWMIKGVYGSFPQAEYWVLLLIVGAGMLVLSLLNVDWGEPKDRESSADRGPGDVQQLAYWIARGRKGFYSRWHVARWLADLALNILEARGYNAKSTRRLHGAGWNPPPEVQKYLETALRTSFADFSRKRSNKQDHTLDIDLNQVVEYLESAVEIEHEHKNP